MFYVLCLYIYIYIYTFLFKKKKKKKKENQSERDLKQFYLNKNKKINSKFCPRTLGFITNYIAELGRIEYMEEVLYKTKSHQNLFKL